LSRRSSCWRWGSTCAFPFRTASTQIRSRCGDESSGMPQKWNDVCALGSDRPTTVGEWTKPTSGSRATGSIYTGLSTPAVRRSTSFCRAKRDAAAAERFLAKALGGENHPAPRVINTDEHADYPPAIVRPGTGSSGDQAPDTRKPAFRSFWGARRTIAGYEAIHMIRKGQAYGSAPAARGGLLHCFILGLFSAVTV
jgi:IS6 family transposase